MYSLITLIYDYQISKACVLGRNKKLKGCFCYTRRHDVGRECEHSASAIVYVYIFTSLHRVRTVTVAHIRKYFA